MTAGSDILDIFPKEILFRILDPDFILPHEQCGFSHASRRALRISNTVLGPLVNSSAIHHSRAEQWKAAFFSLSPKLRDAIEGTRGILPCPALLPQINEQNRRLYEWIWDALEFAHLGEVYMARYYLNEATIAVQKADATSPDVDKILKVARNVIMKVAWTVQTEKRTRKAFENAGKGDEVMTKAYAMGANEAAQEADLPPVDEGSIMRSAWSVKSKMLIERSRNSEDIKTVEWYLERAVVAAEMAEEPPPNIDGIIQETWRRRATKMVRVAIWHAHELDGQKPQKYLDAAIEASQMSGTPSSDDINIIQEVRKAQYYAMVDGAKQFAAKGFYWWAEVKLDAAAKVSKEAGLPAPDRDGIMRQAMTVWSNKERADRLGSDCVEYWTLKDLEEAKHAEHKPDK